MKKKNLLAMAVLLSVLQGSSCFAGVHQPQESILQDGIYKDFVDSTKQSIILHEKYNNKDAVYTFEKGASIVIDAPDWGPFDPPEGHEYYSIFNPISNITDNSLTINVGGELGKDGERYQFYLKPQNLTYVPGEVYKEEPAGIMIGGNGKDNRINLTNTNMFIDLSNSVALGINVGYQKNSEEFQKYSSNLYISANNSDINIFNKGVYNSSNAISVYNGSKLEITGNGKSDINIIGSFNHGIISSEADSKSKFTTLNINGINDINILLNRNLGIGIKANGEKTNIDISGNLNIGSSEKDKTLISGIDIYSNEKSDIDFVLKAKGDINISDAYIGIINDEKFYYAGGNPGNTNVDIIANSITINTKKEEGSKEAYTGTGIVVTDGINQGRNSRFNITANGKDGLNIAAEGCGYIVKGTVNSNIAATSGSININSGSQGFRLTSKTADKNKLMNTIIKAEEDVNIISKYEGIESVVNAGVLEIKAENGSVNIVSGRDAFRQADVSSMDAVGGLVSGYVELSGLSVGKIETNITAKENLKLSGESTGVKYSGVNSGKGNFVSQNGDVYILGNENGMYIDGQAHDNVSGYDGKGNIGKHDITVKADKGSVYIGAFGKDGQIIGDGNGIYNTGRNILNIEANDLVAIQGQETALYAEKETNNIIKGTTIILKSNDYALKSDGVNNIVLGYEAGDNKVTDNIHIEGASSGLRINASTIGQDDIKDGYYSKDNPDILIDGETNSTKLYANNINISGGDSGININQEATEWGHLEETEIYTKWKNNVVDINGNGIVNIVSEYGTGINVNGINKVNIKNTGNNTTINGEYQGVNLMLASDFNADNGADYKKQVFEYIDKTASEAIRANNYSHISVEKWNTTQREQYNAIYENALLHNSSYSSFEEYYSDLLTGENSEALRQDIKDKLYFDITPEELQVMKDKYQDDPIKGMLFAQYSGMPDILKDVFSKLNKTSGEVFTEKFLQSEGLATLKDYFDKLVAEGKLKPVNYNIDVKDEFNLETKGTNTILGGVNAFNIDGKLHALVKGDVNYFSSSNYREDDFDDKRQSSVAVNIVNKGDFRSEGNTNIVKAGKIDKGFGNETAVKVQDGGKAVFVAKNGGNSLSGAAFVGGAGSLEITSNGGNNTILSSNHGTNETENDVNVVNAVFATGKDSAIKIDAGTTGVNNIATDVQFASANQDGREITVWAHDGAGVNINGAVNISASNGANYVNAAKGNALGVAVSAGGRALQYDDTALKPIDNISKVDIIYTSGGKDSFISGDIVAGYGGQVDIHRDKAKDNSLAVNGNILAANNGVTNVDFGNGGSWIGRADDYFAADKKGAVDFFAPAFSNAIKEEGEVNVTMNNSMWSVTGQSWLTSFEGGNNTIDMVNFNARDNSKNLANAVAIRTMNGENNKFIMSLDNVNRHDSDMLYIKDGNATINVEVNGTINGLENVSQENGLRFATVGEGIKLDKIAYQEDGKAFVRGKNGGFFNAKLFVERQDYAKDNQYNTEFNGGEELNAEKPGNAGVEDLFGQDIDKADNLVIVKVEREDMSDAGSTVLDLSKVNYSNAVYMDRFNKRMGEARFIDGDEGIWVRMRHDRIGKDNAFRSNNTMYEIGYDAKQLKEDGEHRVGFAMDYMDGSSSFSKVSGSGEVNRKGLWMYDSWIGEKGHYRDLVAKWGHLSNDFEFMSGAGETTGEFGNNVYSVSAEFGKKNDIGNNWYFEPQAQLQYAHVTGSDYVTTMDGVDQTQIRNDAFNSLIARAGFRIGKDVDARSTVYLKADVMHEFLGEQDVFANDGTTSGEWAKASYDHGGTWYDLGFGYSTKLNEASYVYIDVETSFGNDYEKTYQINGGVQWSF